MKIKLHDHLHPQVDVVGNALIHALTYTDAPEGRALPDTFKTDEDGNIDVQLIVNGIELNFETIMVQYKKHIDLCINETAAELLRTKASKMLDVIYAMERELKDKAIELFPDIYVED